MLRFHFTEADLRRVVVAPAPNALLEVALSVRYLRTPTGTPWSRTGLRVWRHEVTRGLAPRAGILGDLDPPQGGIFDFFVQLSAPDLHDGLDLACRTPTGELADEIAVLPHPVRTAPLLRELADGTALGRQRLARDTRRYFASSLAPLWSRIQAGAVTDRALRAETLLRGGVDAMLATLVPHWSWQPPVLCVPAPCAPRDVRLDGHGLLLVPSYFIRSPMFGRSPGGPMELFYPLHTGERPARATDTLGPLLGRTRAAVLAALRHPAGTSEVAERTGISLPSASEHTTVLRKAGLVSTTRVGAGVLHTLTPLGVDLLRGDSAG
ncbi:ArsR/SmtB family transcription factor [Embleya sp. NPDC050493]|uniref:ArsR/SmtB family transcription factor n=1 Tax=Embleya sp. NPDC050493 TaxID=3363989 RepID=UPI0037903262